MEDWGVVSGSTIAIRDKIQVLGPRVCMQISSLFFFFGRGEMLFPRVIADLYPEPRAGLSSRDLVLLIFNLASSS